MTRTLLVGAVVLAACTTPSSTKVSEPVPAQGKLVAPVAVDAELKETSARLTLRFESAASAAQVTVAGLDGLEVTSASPSLGEGPFAIGDRRAFDVAFRPGEGRSNLVVSVTGTFQGAVLQRVVTFAVGTPTEAQLRGGGTRITTDQGERVKVLPGQVQ